jgi:TolA-binding protein
MASAASGSATSVAAGLRGRRIVLLAAAALITAGSALALGERMRDKATVETTAKPAQALAPVPASSAQPPAAAQAPAAPDPLAAAAPVASAPEQDAVELFSQANEARRHGDTTGAVARYTLLQHRFPHSPEAALSQVALGRLYLDRLHDPGRALAQFDGYLAASNTEGLREEALVGRALALQGLHREAEEKQAWRTLLATYPDSFSSDRANERLRELH